MQWKRENDLPQTIGGIGLGTGLSLLHSSVIRSSTTCSVALVQSADVYSTPVGGARWRNQPRKATSSLYRTELEQLRHAVLLSCENVTDLVNLPPPFNWKVMPESFIRTDNRDSLQKPEKSAETMRKGLVLLEAMKWWPQGPRVL